MKSESSNTVSVWMATADIPRAVALDKNIKTDVCVVGAGIAGLTTAYLLAKEGRKVVVLDRASLAGGETSRTTAHLAYVIDDGFQEIERLHGVEWLRLHVQSHQTAIDKIERTVREEHIECDFTRLDGYLFASDSHAADYIQHELEAAQRAYIKDFERVDRVPLPFGNGPGLRFPNQGQFHPLKYLSGLLHALGGLGAQTFPYTVVERIEDGNPVRVHTATGHVVECSAGVIATNSPTNDVVAIHTKQAPYRTYALAAPIPKDSISLALYWDTEDPYHYVRLQPAADHDLLIIGGEDHKTGQGDPNVSFAKLEKWARERFVMIREIEFRWSGQVLEPVDCVAFIGRNPGDDHVYVATGDSGMGMTHGTIAGILLTDLIQGRRNSWAELYDPTRKTVGAVPEFIKENVNVAAQYGDWVKPGNVATSDDIRAGEGALIRSGAKKIAVYRDPERGLHACSAVCTHLGCLVSWNSVEKSWDCPCHGSRFDPLGRVLNGPAVRDLQVIDDLEVTEKS
jgi:glycine/D-amino acid oxidase-like deaminating enzyme/nitrite reductase/ring-hydroxylating ferredoxin subunit